jgi:hypothetical protein
MPDKKLTYDNFGKYRHTWIYEADRICRDCCELIEESPAMMSLQSQRHWRRAAKLFERAADFFKKAGLGLCAKAAWSSASECYGALLMHDDKERCRLKSVSIPAYYEEDL